MTEQKKAIYKVDDEDKEYTFVLMNAETGLKMFHEYAAIAAGLVRPIMGVLFKEEKEGDGEFGTLNKALDAVELLSHIVTFDKLQELCKVLLPGTTVKVGGEVHTVGDSGIGDYTAGDPFEVYLSVYYALQANYPGVIAPLAKALMEEEGESDSNTNQQKKK